MEILRKWISDICITILFMTAIELILPNNSIKKYSKFVLGLIFIGVVITPVITILKSDYDISRVILNNETYIKTFDIKDEENIEDYMNRIKETTLKNFEKNLSDSCEQLLKSKFKEYSFDVMVSADYLDDSYEVKDIQIKVHDGSIKKVDKVVLDENAPKIAKEETRELKNMKSYLSKELNISQNIIKIYN